MAKIGRPKEKREYDNCRECGADITHKVKRAQFCNVECKNNFFAKRKGHLPRIKCKLSGCKNWFNPKNKNNFYCCPEHQREGMIRSKNNSRSTVPKKISYGFDIWPTKSGIAGVETNSTIFNPMG